MSKNKKRKLKKKRLKRLQKESKMVIRIGELNKQKEELETVDVNDIKPSDMLVNSIVSDNDDIKIDGDLCVEMDRDIYNKMMTYAKLTDEEIAGLGYVEQVDKNRFKITEIFLPKQTVSKARCVCDIDDQCRIMQELIDQGKNPGNLKMWWHSHNSMGTFWSGQDEHTGFISACDYFISIVVNHKMELRCKINICNPIEIAIDNVEVVVINSMPEEQTIENCKKDIHDKVFEISFRTTYNNNMIGFNNNNNYKYHGFQDDAEQQDDGDVNSEVMRQRELFENPCNKDMCDIECVNQEIDAPYGKYFLYNTYKFTWNKAERKYDVSDSFNRKLTDGDLDDIHPDLYELANPYEFDNKNNIQQ